LLIGLLVVLTSRSWPGVAGSRIPRFASRGMYRSWRVRSRTLGDLLSSLKVRNPGLSTIHLLVSVQMSLQIQITIKTRITPHTWTCLETNQPINPNQPWQHIPNPT